MPRYFFDLHNDIESIDDEGKVLPDLKAATTRGFIEAREMVCSSVEEHCHIDLRHRIEIRDKSGQTVRTIHFEDAVTILREGVPV